MKRARSNTGLWLGALGEGMSDSDLGAARRRRIAIRSAAGDGEMAGIEMGPQDRPVDILFLHANGFNARTYRSILLPLAGQFRILAVDQRGHGLTSLAADIPDDRNNWYGFRDDLLGLLEALDQQPLVLGGHSMGGAASLMAAAEAPHRVKRLALFDPVILARDMQNRVGAGEIRESPLVQGALRRRAVFDSYEAVETSFNGRGIFKSWSDEALHDYVGDGFRPRAEGGVELTCAPAWEASNFVSQRHDTWSCFERSQCPIRILRAETGSTCRVEGHEAELTASGRIRIETIPGTTHFLPMERSDLVREALTEAVLA